MAKDRRDSPTDPLLRFPSNSCNHGCQRDPVAPLRSASCRLLSYRLHYQCLVPPKIGRYPYRTPLFDGLILSLAGLLLLKTGSACSRMWATPDVSELGSGTAGMVLALGRLRLEPRLGGRCFRS